MGFRACADGSIVKFVDSVGRRCAEGDMCCTGFVSIVFVNYMAIDILGGTPKRDRRYIRDIPVRLLTDEEIWIADPKANFVSFLSKVFVSQWL